MTAAGCGRIGFDAHSDAATDTPVPDAASIHDEDGDGVLDGTDVCPHIPDAGQADMDGDRVGDACDPNPAAGNERIVRFDSLVTPMLDIMATGSAVPLLDGDTLRADTQSGDITLDVQGLTVGRDTITIGGFLGATSPVNRRQLSLSAVEDLGFIYCELYEHMGIEKWGLVWTPDNSTFFTVDAGTLTQTIASHAFRTSLAFDPGTGDSTCSTTFPVDKITLQAQITTVVPNAYTIYAQGIDLRLDYIIVIRTP